LEARFKTENNQRNRRFANTVNIGPAIANENISDTVIREHMLQPVPRAFTPACNGNALPRAPQAGDVTTKNLKDVDAILRAFGCEVASLLAAKVDAYSFWHTERRKLTHAAGRQNIAPLPFGEVEHVRLQRLVARHICGNLRLLPVLARFHS